MSGPITYVCLGHTARLAWRPTGLCDGSSKLGQGSPLTRTESQRSRPFHLTGPLDVMLVQAAGRRVAFLLWVPEYYP